MIDIRDRIQITHEDVTALNFVKDACPYVFRQHFRQGLRSHVMEVHEKRKVLLETSGIVKNGIPMFPRSEPIRMLRIFRTRFPSLAEAKKEMERFVIVQSHLSKDLYAASEEFLVDYRSPGGKEILLCGFQEYVKGEILDPWGTALNAEKLSRPFQDEPGRIEKDEFVRNITGNAGRFVRSVKSLINRTGYIPDLAGIGNLLVTREGRLALVDINNICPIAVCPEILLDDKGYPVCDKSMEVLFLLERHLAEGRPDRKDPFYDTFMDPERKKEVDAYEKRFYSRIKSIKM